MTRAAVSMFGALLGGLALTTTAAAQTLLGRAPALPTSDPQVCELRPPGKEVIKAIIAQTGGAPQAGHSRVSIAVESYAPVAEKPLGFDSESACMICIVVPNGPSAGTVSIDGQVAYQIQRAQSMPRESGRRLFLVLTASSSLPPLPPAQSVDGRFGVVVLDVDSRGRGTGELITSARLGLDAGGFVEVQQPLAPIQFLAEVKVVQ